MAFEVRVNGETVFKTPAQILTVALQSAQGEMFKGGVNSMGVVDVVLEQVQPGSPPRLDQVEAAQAQFLRSLSEGQVVGTAPVQYGSELNVRQGEHTYTTEPGGIPEGDDTVSYPPPSLDLSTGLDPSDSDALTKRIEAYGEHGDAAKAIADVPPSDPDAPTEPTPEEPTEPEVPAEGLTV
jgi:hypothetical protein